VWGAVAEVGARELVVSLPHGLRGHVALTEVPPATPAGAWQLLRLGLHAGPPTVLQFCRCTLSALAPSRARSLEVRQAGSAASWSKHLCTHPIWLRPLLNPHERRQASDVLAELVVKAEAAAAAAAAAGAGPPAGGRARAGPARGCGAGPRGAVQRGAAGALHRHRQAGRIRRCARPPARVWELQLSCRHCHLRSGCSRGPGRDADVVPEDDSLAP